MANRLTDRQRKKIVADYLELGSYNAVAKIHGVSRQTVKNIVTSDTEMGHKLQQKKAENTAVMEASAQERTAQRHGSPWAVFHAAGRWGTGFF